MVVNTIFFVSGLAIAALIGAKVIEDRRKKKPLLLRLVSLGDERVRVWYHEFAHKYSDLKEKGKFIVEKQLPLHSKNIFNKTSTVIKENVEKRIGDIRGSKFLKRSDGISEYFKKLSQEEDNGRIDEEVVKKED